MKQTYPNLQAVIEGRVSGNIAEWPQIRTELAAIYSFISTLEAQLNAERESVDELSLALQEAESHSKD